MRVYDAFIKISGLNSARTLLYVTVASNKIVRLLHTSVTDASNETNEQLEVVWQKITTVGTPTKTDITPTKHDQGDAASGATVAGNVTASEPTYTANVVFGQQGFPSLTGYLWPPTPLPLVAYRVFTVGDSWGLRLLSTPTAFDAIILATWGEEG